MAPEARGAHRHRIVPKRSCWVLAALLSFGWAGGAFAGTGELQPWSDEAIPPLVLDRLDGDRIALTELSGRPLIVHFFATWCAPCIEEMASLNALAALSQVDIGILAVDVGEVDARVRTFFRERPVTFPVLLDRDRAAMKRWRVQGLPTSFVLDRNLRPALKTEEPLDWAGPGVVRALTALSRQTNGAPAEPATGENETREVIQ